MKKFNINEFIWFIILFLLWCTVFMLYKTGLLYSYVNSKSEKLIVVALVFLGLLCAVQCLRIFTFPTRENIKMGNFIFIFALLLILANRGSYISSFIEIQGITLIENTEEHHSHGGDESLLEEGKVVINNNIHEFLHKYYEHGDKYNGKEVEIEGLVYKPKEIEGGFIIARQEINCCAADAENLGIICKGDIDIPEDYWVKVEGTLESENIKFREQKGTVPVIKINKVTSIKKNG